MVHKEVNRIEPWLDQMFQAFGATRIIFSSDWPVWNIEGDGNGVGWMNWFTILKHWAERLTAYEQDCLWRLNAAHAYNITHNYLAGVRRGTSAGIRLEAPRV
jgi:predicted TIM-barrel fold metal-dependent hydrolase